MEMSLLSFAAKIWLIEERGQFGASFLNFHKVWVLTFLGALLEARGGREFLPTWLRGKKEQVFLKISSIYQRKKVFFLILDFCACRQTLKFSPPALGSFLYETIDFCGGFQ